MKNHLLPKPSSKSSVQHTVMITGANRGLGLGWVQHYLVLGWNVIACCRIPAHADALHDLKIQFPEQLTVYELDITNQKNIRYVVSQLAISSLDLLINNAGIFPRAHENLLLENINPQDIQDAFIVNALGPFCLTRELKKLLMASARPVVVNMASQMGSIGTTANSRGYAYRMSKSALNMFTKCFALEAPHIITISLRPGWVKTVMGGADATLEVEESIRTMAQVIANISSHDSGKVLDNCGVEQPV